MVTQNVYLARAMADMLHTHSDSPRASITENAQFRFLRKVIRSFTRPHSRIFNRFVKKKYQERHSDEYVPLYESVRRKHRSDRIESVLENSSEAKRSIEDVDRKLSEHRKSTLIWQTVSVIISILSLTFGVISSV